MDEDAKAKYFMSGEWYMKIIMKQGQILGEGRGHSQSPYRGKNIKYMIAKEQ